MEEFEESWTFIGDDNDPDLIRRIHDWENMAQSGSLAGRNSSGDAMAMSTMIAGDIEVGNGKKVLGTPVTATSHAGP